MEAKNQTNTIIRCLSKTKSKQKSSTQESISEVQKVKCCLIQTLDENDILRSRIIQLQALLAFQQISLKQKEDQCNRLRQRKCYCQRGKLNPQMQYIFERSKIEETYKEQKSLTRQNSCTF